MLRKTLFVWILLAFFVAGAMGQSDSEPGSKAWVEAQIERARNFEIPKGFRFKWREEQYRLMTDAELAQARKRVAKKPDHPDRFIIMGESQRIEKGADIWEREVFYGDENHWRFNRTTLAPNPSFGDMSVDGKLAWQFSTMQIQYLDSQFPPRGFEPSSRRSIFEYAIRQVMLGPFDLPSTFQYEVIAAGFTSDGMWNCRFRSTDHDYAWTITGRMDGSTLVDAERKIFRATNDRLELQSISRYPSLIQSEKLGYLVFDKVLIYLIDGTLSRESSLIEIDNLEPSQLRQVLRRPSLGGEDSIRGSITTTQIVDYRNGGVVLNDKEQGGKIVQTQVRGRPIEQIKNENRIWRVAGILSGLVLVIIAITVWWSRKQPI